MTDARRLQLTLLLCCVAQFMVVLDVSIVNVALPSIRSDLGFSSSQLQWVVNAYTLAFAGFLLLGGRAADLLGPRLVCIGGLSVFAVASLVGGLAQSEGMLVVARGVQGLGGAIVAPATLSILTTSFAQGAVRNRALGLWGAMGGVGGAAGGVLGGLLTDTLGWRWILFINLPIGLAAALLALRVVRSGTVPGASAPRSEFDLAGALSVTLGLVGLTYGIVSTEQHGWTAARTLVPLLVGLGLLALFVGIEARVARRPLLPLRILRSRELSGANVIVLLMGGATFSMWYLASLYMQEVLGYDALQTGLAFLPMTLVLIGASQVASRLVSRIGPGPVLAGGMLLIATGLAGFSGASAGGSWSSDVLWPGLVAGAGIGCSFVPVTIAATNGVRPADAGLASGVVNTSRQVGGTLGLALLATLATQRTTEADPSGRALGALADGFDRAFLVGAGFAVAGAVLTLLLLVRRAPSAVPAT